MEETQVAPAISTYVTFKDALDRLADNEGFDLGELKAAKSSVLTMSFEYVRGEKNLFGKNDDYDEESEEDEEEESEDSSPKAKGKKAKTGKAANPDKPLEKILKALHKVVSWDTFCCGGSLVPKDFKRIGFVETKKPEAGEAESEKTYWECPICTYHNRLTFLVCDGCSNVRPEDAVPAKAKAKTAKRPAQGKKSVKGQPKEVPTKNCGAWTTPKVQKILAMCNPAPFGDLKTQQTVYDPSVRLAWERRFVEGDKGMQPAFLNAIVDHIKEALCSDSQKIEAVPYKLNVYGPGGFFKPHVDTPTHPSDSVATLVICLPSVHTGGELVVGHDGQQQVYDWSTPEGRNTPAALQWAAFYTDCVHEVLPVKSGYRVTMTYSIVAKKEAKSWYYFRGPSILADEWEKGPMISGPPLRPRRRVPAPSKAPWGKTKKKGQAKEKEKFEEPFSFEAARKELVSSIRDYSGNMLGLLLSFKYTQGGLRFEVLKGVDRIVFDILKSQPGWVFNLMPVVCRMTHSTYHDSAYGEDERSSRVYAFSAADLAWLMQTVGAKKPKHPEIGEHKINFVRVQRGQVLQHEHEAGAENTGNEAAPERTDVLYFHGALIINKPGKGVVPSLFQICRGVISWNRSLWEAGNALEALPEEVQEKLRRWY